MMRATGKRRNAIAWTRGSFALLASAVVAACMISCATATLEQHSAPPSEQDTNQHQHQHQRNASQLSQHVRVVLNGVRSGSSGMRINQLDSLPLCVSSTNNDGAFTFDTAHHQGLFSSLAEDAAAILLNSAGPKNANGTAAKRRALSYRTDVNQQLLLALSTSPVDPSRVGLSGVDVNFYAQAQTVQALALPTVSAPLQGRKEMPLCPLGVAVIFRYECPSSQTQPDYGNSSNTQSHQNHRFPKGSFGHLDADCIIMRKQTSPPPFCSPKLSIGKTCTLNTVPLPTADQQVYQRHEIVGLTHFNMATFVRDGDPACNADNWNKGVNSSNPATFNPKNLNISNWVESYRAVGVKHAVLTAKHGCGFLLWNTSTTLPSGEPYGFAVQRKDRPSYPRNVIREFSTTLQAAGIGHGFYYSTGNNFYLNRINNQPAGSLLPGQAQVNDTQYNHLVFEHVKELWSTFGELTEIWFDHGYATSQKAALMKLLQTYQPHASGFNGFGLMTNPIKWCGTESGHPPYPVWSTGCETSSGNPSSTTYCPTGGDTTLQDFDHWFWVPDTPIRSLAEMISVYHDTVGNNNVLELDFAIDRDGLIDPVHAAAYKQLGDWIRNCYGENNTVANISSSASPGQLLLTMNFTTPTVIDRFMLQEEFSLGERVRSWTVSVDTTAQGGKGGSLENVASGSVIGYKQIVVLKTPIEAKSATLQITSAVMPPSMKTFAAFSSCSE